MVSSSGLVNTFVAYVEKIRKSHSKSRGGGIPFAYMQQSLHEVERTFPIGLCGVLIKIILVLGEKAASSSCGSKVQSLEEPGCFPCCSGGVTAAMALQLSNPGHTHGGGCGLETRPS